MMVGRRHLPESTVDPRRLGDIFEMRRRYGMPSRVTLVETARTRNTNHVLPSNPIAAPRRPRGPQPSIRVRTHPIQHLFGRLAHVEDVATLSRQTRRIANQSPNRVPTNKRNESPKFGQEAV